MILKHFGLHKSFDNFNTFLTLSHKNLTLVAQTLWHGFCEVVEEQFKNRNYGTDIKNRKKFEANI